MAQENNELIIDSLLTYSSDMKLRVKFTTYDVNGRTAIRLYNADEDSEYAGELVATATINLPELPLGEDEVVIKDYSENEGMVATLQSAGIIGDLIGNVESGFVSPGIYKLLKKG